MERIKNFLRGLPPWSLSVVCALAIAWLTLASKPLGDNELPLFPHADKLAHAIMFGGFVFCMIIDWQRQRDWRHCTVKAGVIAAAVSIAAGILTEMAQTAMHAGRSGDPLDLLADAAGAILVAFCSIYIVK